jgi:hypothetical protein
MRAFHVGCEGVQALAAAVNSMTGNDDSFMKLEF